MIRATFRLAFLAFGVIGISFAHVVKHVEVQFLPLDGSSEHGDTPGKRGGHGALPLQQFMRMFPMDLPPGSHVRVIHLGGGGGLEDGGNNLGDQILNSILSELSSGFHSEMKPLMSSVQAADRGKEHPCIQDIKKFCSENHSHGHEHMSDLHCLGMHAKDISLECAREVQQSLPFVCSVEISRFCSSRDTIEQSVLQCLEDKVDANARIDPECKDSIGATRAVVNKMKTQNVALVDKRTGAIIKSTANFISTPVYISVWVAGLVVVGILLYAFWMRDDETNFLKSIQKTLRDMRMKLLGKRNRERLQGAHASPSTELKSSPGSGYSL